MSARRRRKAIARRGWVESLRRQWDYALDRIPFDATSIFMCSCGARAYLFEHSSAADQEWFVDLFDQHEDCGEVIAA